MSRGSDLYDVTADNVAYTYEALAAVPGDAELSKLAARAGGLLRDWECIEADGDTLERAVIRATAHVRVADATLDAALTAFADDLVTLVDGNLSHALYEKFFPEPHEDVIAMGLDAEVPEVTLIVHALDAAPDAVPGKLHGHVEPLRAALRAGNAALAQRADALADMGRHMARVEAWHETAASALQALEARVARIATARNLPVQWAEAYFNF